MKVTSVPHEDFSLEMYQCKRKLNCYMSPVNFVGLELVPRPRAAAVRREDHHVSVEIPTQCSGSPPKSLWHKLLAKGKTVFGGVRLILQGIWSHP